jgi:hypothetical protein
MLKDAGDFDRWNAKKGVLGYNPLMGPFGFPTDPFVPRGADILQKGSEATIKGLGDNTPFPANKWADEYNKFGPRMTEGLIDSQKDQTHAQKDATERLQQSIDASKANQTSLESLTRTVDLLNVILSRNAAGGAGWLGGAGGPLSDIDNTLYYEHPDTEGRSSQFGPKNNRLGYAFFG